MKRFSLVTLWALVLVLSFPLPALGWVTQGYGIEPFAEFGEAVPWGVKDDPDARLSKEMVQTFSVPSLGFVPDEVYAGYFSAEYPYSGSGTQQGVPGTGSYTCSVDVSKFSPTYYNAAQGAVLLKVWADFAIEFDSTKLSYAVVGPSFTPLEATVAPLTGSTGTVTGKHPVDGQLAAKTGAMTGERDWVSPFPKASAGVDAGKGNAAVTATGLYAWRTNAQGDREVAWAVADSADLPLPSSYLATGRGTIGATAKPRLVLTCPTNWIQTRKDTDGEWVEVTVGHPSRVRPVSGHAFPLGVSAYTTATVEVQQAFDFVDAGGFASSETSFTVPTEEVPDFDPEIPDPSGVDTSTAPPSWVPGWLYSWARDTVLGPITSLSNGFKGLLWPLKEVASWVSVPQRP